MNSTIRTAALAATAFALLAAPEASATNYSLWIHGKNGGGTQIGNYADFSNWGPSSVSAGVNKKAVNWNGSQSISSQNGYIRNALDCFCTGTNWCYIAVHSAGDMQIGYTRDTLANLQRLWTRPVHLETVLEGKITTFSYDGHEHKSETTK